MDKPGFGTHILDIRIFYERLGRPRNLDPRDAKWGNYRSILGTSIPFIVAESVGNALKHMSWLRHGRFLMSRMSSL